MVHLPQHLGARTSTLAKTTRYEESYSVALDSNPPPCCVAFSDTWILAFDGVMVRCSIYSFNIPFLLQTSRTTRRPWPSYHVSCFRLMTPLLILSFLLFLYSLYYSFIDITLLIHGPCAFGTLCRALLVYQTCTNTWSVCTSLSSPV